MEKLCKNCKHAKPPYDTSKEWRKKAICYSPQAMLSMVDGTPPDTCIIQRDDARKRDIPDKDWYCGVDGAWFEPN